MRIFYVYKEDKCNFSPGEVKREKRKGKKQIFILLFFGIGGPHLISSKRKKMLFVQTNQMTVDNASQP